MTDKSTYDFANTDGLIAGVIGVIISLLHRRSKSWKTTLIGFLTGSSTVWFAAPPLNSWLRSEPQTAALISFILGLCAVKLTEAIINDPFGVLNFLRAALQGEKAEKPKDGE